MRLRLGWTISYKSLYFVHPCLDLMPLFTGMRERTTDSCITAVKWDTHDAENTAGNARRCNPGCKILLTFSWQHQQKNFYQFFYCDLWKASFIVHYQSYCIPKSNSKQETLQAIYSCILVFIQWVYYYYFFLFIATKNVLFLFCLYNTAQIFLSNSSSWQCQNSLKRRNSKYNNCNTSLYKSDIRAVYLRTASFFIRAPPNHQH